MSHKTISRHMMWCAGLVLIAFGLFAYLFLGAGDVFWPVLALSVAGLCAAAILAEPDGMRDVLRSDSRSHRSPIIVLVSGAGSAALLYGVFALGNLLVRRFLPFGAAEIEAVYHQGAGTPRWIVAILLLAVVGPGEEIFWRGYVQRRWSAELGCVGFALSILAYTGVHVATGNLTLILAAFVCGGFWALLYRYVGSLRINIVSHALWAAAIFVWWPLR